MERHGEAWFPEPLFCVQIHPASILTAVLVRPFPAKFFIGNLRIFGCRFAEQETGIYKSSRYLPAYYGLDACRTR